eukprot:TRINITY_DN41389_c0_g1_i1.p1 TRINITY_DN41389_c0_g1~~TRINITY_DN41389_c0_g1_i1.p1  ORF type:complete len:526 (+),score=64.38 TRINITY_DN41389_c0_g1_i1:63-1640(+)
MDNLLIKESCKGEGEAMQSSKGPGPSATFENQQESFQEESETSGTPVLRSCESSIKHTCNSAFVLDRFQDDIVLSVISHLDHATNCRMQACCRLCKRIGHSPYVWRQLFETARGLCNVLEDTGPRDWLGEFKRLKPCWDDAIFRSDGNSCLQMLLDQQSAPPNSGGQDPRIFCLGSGQLLVLSGATYGERRGGFDLRQSSGAYLMDVRGCLGGVDTGVGSSGDGGADGSSGNGVTWKSVEVSGQPHPALHGSYCGAFGDGVVADKVVCFGGGNHMNLYSVTSLLEVSGLVSEGGVSPSPKVHWKQLTTFAAPGSPDDSPNEPCARFAGLGCVWGSSLLALAGRTPSEFFDELWVLNLQSLEWSRPELSGEGPSPRVWLRGARCGDVLLVYGGAEWRFDPGCWGNDTPGTVWALHVEALRWERLALTGCLRPPLRVCPAMAMCGCHLLVYGGVDLSTQEYMDDAWLFDTRSHEWTEIEVSYSDETDRWCRSHATAIFSRERRSCFIFGGARYLEGVYFHEVLELSA